MFKKHLLIKIISIFIGIAIAFTSSNYFISNVKSITYASIINQPLINKLIDLKIGISQKFSDLPLIRGIKVNLSNLNQWEFHFDTMDKKNITNIDIDRMLKYFFGFLAIPEEDLWVNLSSDEKDRIIPESLSRLNIGKDLLIGDYLLKSLTCYLTNPNNKYGKAYWDKLEKVTSKISSSKKLNHSNFYKIWIIPEKAVIYRDKDSIFIQEAKLKVMLEEDFLRVVKNQNIKISKLEKTINKKAKKIFKEQLLPVISQQVNYADSFAPLRQIYYAFILATYLKNDLSKDKVFGQYINQKKIANLTLPNNDQSKKIVYQSYLDNLNRGVYNTIQKKYDQNNKRKILQRYFSGGLRLELQPIPSQQKPNFKGPEKICVVKATPQIDTTGLGDYLDTGKEWMVGFYQRAEKREQKGKIALAESDYRKVIQIYKNIEKYLAIDANITDAMDLYIIAAQAYFNLNNYDQAIDSYSKAINSAKKTKAWPSLARTYYMRAIAESKKNQFRASLDDFNNSKLVYKQINRNKEIETVYRQIIYLYEKMAKKIEEEENIDQAGLSHCYRIIGNAYYNLDFFLESKEIYHKAVKLEESFKQKNYNKLLKSLYSRAQANLRLGNLEEAYTDLENVFKPGLDLSEYLYPGLKKYLDELFISTKQGFILSEQEIEQLEKINQNIKKIFSKERITSISKIIKGIEDNANLSLEKYKNNNPNYRLNASSLMQTQRIVDILDAIRGKGLIPRTIDNLDTQSLADGVSLLKKMLRLLMTKDRNIKTVYDLNDQLWKEGIDLLKEELKPKALTISHVSLQEHPASTENEPIVIKDRVDNILEKKLGDYITKKSFITNIANSFSFVLKSFSQIIADWYQPILIFLAIILYFIIVGLNYNHYWNEKFEGYKKIMNKPSTTLQQKQDKMRDLINQDRKKEIGNKLANVKDTNTDDIKDQDSANKQKSSLPSLASGKLVEIIGNYAKQIEDINKEFSQELNKYQQAMGILENYFLDYSHKLGISDVASVRYYQLSTGKVVCIDGSSQDCDLNINKIKSLLRDQGFHDLEVEQFIVFLKDRERVYPEYINRFFTQEEIDRAVFSEQLGLLLRRYQWNKEDGFYRLLRDYYVDIYIGNTLSEEKEKSLLAGANALDKDLGSLLKETLEFRRMVAQMKIFDKAINSQGNILQERWENLNEKFFIPAGRYISFSGPYLFGLYKINDYCKTVIHNKPVTIYFTERLFATGSLENTVGIYYYNKKNIVIDETLAMQTAYSHNCPDKDIITDYLRHEISHHLFRNKLAKLYKNNEKKFLEKVSPELYWKTIQELEAHLTKVANSNYPNIWLKKFFVFSFSSKQNEYTYTSRIICKEILDKLGYKEFANKNFIDMHIANIEKGGLVIKDLGNKYGVTTKNKNKEAILREIWITLKLKGPRMTPDEGDFYHNFLSFFDNLSLVIGRYTLEEKDDIFKFFSQLNPQDIKKVLKKFYKGFFNQEMPEINTTGIINNHLSRLKDLPKERSKKQAQDDEVAKKIAQLNLDRFKKLISTANTDQEMDNIIKELNILTDEMNKYISQSKFIQPISKSLNDDLIKKGYIFNTLVNRNQIILVLFKVVEKKIKDDVECLYLHRITKLDDDKLLLLPLGWAPVKEKYVVIDLDTIDKIARELINDHKQTPTTLNILNGKEYLNLYIGSKNFNNLLSPNQLAGMSDSDIENMLQKISPNIVLSSEEINNFKILYNLFVQKYQENKSKYPKNDDKYVLQNSAKEIIETLECELAMCSLSNDIFSRYKNLPEKELASLLANLTTDHEIEHQKNIRYFAKLGIKSSDKRIISTYLEEELSQLKNTIKEDNWLILFEILNEAYSEIDYWNNQESYYWHILKGLTNCQESPRKIIEELKKIFDQKDYSILAYRAQLMYADSIEEKNRKYKMRQTNILKNKLPKDEESMSLKDNRIKQKDRVGGIKLQRDLINLEVKYSNPKQVNNLTSPMANQFDNPWFQGIRYQIIEIKSA